MSQPLRDYLGTFQFLQKDEIEAFLELVTPLKLQKGDFFIQDGRTSRHIAFINAGVFRTFYYSSGDEEVTYCFTFKNTLITAYTSWILQQPTNENIEALTDMDLLLISKDSVDALESRFPNWITFFKQIAEREYMGLERRIFMLQRESAENRYQDLLTNHPEYLNTIPLQYLASYLGVTQRHLSRIRKKLVF